MSHLVSQLSSKAEWLNSKLREEKVAGQGKGKTGQDWCQSTKEGLLEHVHSVSTLTRPPLSASTKALRSFFTQFHPGTRRQKLKDTPTL